MKNLFVLNMAKLALFVFLGSLLACSKELIPSVPPQQEQAPGVSVKNGRLTFKTTADFSRTLDQLIAFKSEDKIEKWESDHQFNSLRKYNENYPLAKHLADMDLPVIFKVILNSDGEYMVGDTIVWLDKGYNYFIPNNDEKLLAAVKLDPVSYKERHKIILTNVAPKAKKDGDIRVSSTNIGTNSGPDARYQSIWPVNGQTGPWRKIVFEVQAFSYNIGGSPYQYFQGVYIRVKLEWWSPSHGWQAGAGETQDPMINVTANVTGFYDYWHGYNYTVTQTCSSSASFNTTTPHTTYNHDTELYLFAETRQEFASSYTVDVSGTISSSVTMSGVYQYNSPYTVSSTTLW